ncbi:uncharacterized protein TNCV_1707231 [Trichonephila clavipes]|uniref:Uncharacterized protein n=1 Tax=Trichonephila clavipes TaxID=2585209 RepID=A0A8X6V273_TRICX|nr:uncharacterized protein TNCV_1707231 [Trichonephila clavipes]
MQYYASRHKACCVEQVFFFQFTGDRVNNLQLGLPVVQTRNLVAVGHEVQYFVREGFVGHRSRVSSKHLSSHLPVDGVRFLGGQKGIALQLQDARVGVGSNKDADVDVRRSNVTALALSYRTFPLRKV